MARRNYLALPLAIVCFLAVGSTAYANTPPFAPDSVWNLPLRADAPISPNSAGYVQWFANQVETGTPWINSITCNDPIYVAPLGTPTTTVTITTGSYQDAALIDAWKAVPIPAGATPANCSDKNFAVQQTQANGAVKQWEFWNAVEQSNGTWTASWGGVINNILTDRGIASPIAWNDPTTGQRSEIGWNVTASSLSMTAGVITAADLESGEINHALAVAIPNAASGVWMWPAQRSDGTSTDPDALPEGAHLRINPNVDLANISMTPMVRMMAEAAQKYGIIVRDKTVSTTTAFYTQQLSAVDQTLLSHDLDGEYANKALAAFPWNDLEVLAAPTCTNAAVACSVVNTAVIQPSTSSPYVGESVELDTTNSTLNYPRSAVTWDLDSGSFNTPDGAAVSTTWVPQKAGEQQIGVRITTTDGTTTTGWVTVDVASAPKTPAVGTSSETTSSANGSQTSTSGTHGSTAGATTAATGAQSSSPAQLSKTASAAVAGKNLTLVATATGTQVDANTAKACSAHSASVVARISAKSTIGQTQARLSSVTFSLDSGEKTTSNKLPASRNVPLAKLSPGLHSISAVVRYTDQKSKAARLAGHAHAAKQAEVFSKSLKVTFRVC